jgi:hypothetical protein
MLENDEAFWRGYNVCYQDRCENVPFSSAGGLDARASLVAPDYIKPDEAGAYLDGYRAMARELYGENWQTCEFEWSPALTIGGNANP